MLKKRIDLVFVLVLLAVSIPLRFINLGYADYIGDEHKSFIRLNDGETLKEFFFTQRKGPMQFLVSEIPHQITGDFNNELAQRIPYALLSVGAVVVFYFLIKKLTQDSLVAFISSFLYTTSGFIIGFGRISQYQNLNLLFSFTALFFYADIVLKKENLIRSTLLGTLFFCLSLFSHWDAVFIIPLVAIFFIKFLLNKEFSKEFKIKLIVFNFILGCLVLLPYLIPYINWQRQLPSNIRYLTRRVEFGYFIPDRYKYLIELYNPFVTFWVLLTGGITGAVFYKRTWMYTVWFVAVYAVFEIVVRKPGTHIYNFLLPAFILNGFAFVWLYRFLLEKSKILLNVYRLFMLVLASFLVYQGYIIFVDHTAEYPWEEETYFLNFCEEERDRRGQLTECAKFLHKNFETPQYFVDDKPPLFGFPHRRNWNEINITINEDIAANNLEGYGFTTNEEKTIAQRYVDADYRADGGIYIVGIKKPQSFTNDWTFTHIGNKKLIREIEVEGEVVTTIWRLDPEDNDYKP